MPKREIMHRMFGFKPYVQRYLLRLVVVIAAGSRKAYGKKMLIRPVVKLGTIPELSSTTRLLILSNL